MLRLWLLVLRLILSRISRTISLGRVTRSRSIRQRDFSLYRITRRWLGNTQLPGVSFLRSSHPRLWIASTKWRRLRHIRSRRIMLLLLLLLQRLMPRKLAISRLIHAFPLTLTHYLSFPLLRLSLPQIPLPLPFTIFPFAILHLSLAHQLSLADFNLALAFHICITFSLFSLAIAHNSLFEPLLFAECWDVISVTIT